MGEKHVGHALFIIGIMLGTHCRVFGDKVAFFDHVHGIHKDKRELARVDRTQLSMMLDQLIKKKRTQFSLNDIVRLHHVIYKNIDRTHAGRLRQSSVHINGMVPPRADTLPRHMNTLVAWLRTSKEHPLKMSAQAHLKVVDIHPFKDGNGRIARTLLALLLLQNGYPVPTFSVNDRKRYAHAIHRALKTGKTDEYYKLMYQGINRSFDNIKGKF
jgi:Fic family protein